MSDEIKSILDTLKAQWPIAEIKLRGTILDLIKERDELHSKINNYVTYTDNRLSDLTKERDKWKSSFKIQQDAANKHIKQLEARLVESDKRADRLQNRADEYFDKLAESEKRNAELNSEMENHACDRCNEKLSASEARCKEIETLMMKAGRK